MYIISFEHISRKEETVLIGYCFERDHAQAVVDILNKTEHCPNDRMFCFRNLCPLIQYDEKNLVNKFSRFLKKPEAIKFGK